MGSGSRELASGSAGLAVVGGATAAYWNPARLASVEQIGVSGFHSQLFESGVSYQYAGLAYPTVDYGGFGMGIFRLGIGGIDKRDQSNLHLGEFDDNRLGFYLGYGRQLGGYDFGLSLSIEHHAIDDYSATSSPGLSLAAMKKLDLDSEHFTDFALAVVGRNILRPGFKIVQETVEYPMSAEFGASLRIVPNQEWDQGATLSLRIAKIDQVATKLSAGLDYNVQSLLSVRVGVNDGKLSVGGGLSYRGIVFDYALVDRDMGSLHLFSLSTSFGATVSERRKTREVKREREFNNLMSERLLSRRREMVQDLLAQGRNARQNGDLAAAVDFLDRALFLVRAMGADTTAISEEHSQVVTRLADVENLQLYGQYIDSARMRLDQQDFVAAQYYANLAIEKQPGAPQALNLLSQIGDAMAERSTRSETAARRAAMADSLLNYGQIDRASAVLDQLSAEFPDYHGLKSLSGRAAFEQFKARASELFRLGNYDGAANLTDSAAALFPGHSWCSTMREQIAQRREAAMPAPSATKPTVAARPALSRELAAEVESSYRTAQELFESGELDDAVTYWEEVERLAPDYKSTREYLVQAYKFVGVEFYGQGELAGAVAVWEKAIQLAPDNREIAGYLERTRTEIAKLREYSYDNH
jgi:tetratricopeptide (TPR) repeat protein